MRLRNWRKHKKKTELKTITKTELKTITKTELKTITKTLISLYELKFKKINLKRDVVFKN